MVKVHGKTSKRMPLRQKYNINQKVRSHNKKEAKMARKLKRSGHIKSVQKEPGIPNLFPYKKQMIEQMENKQRQDEDQKKMAKELRRKLRKETQASFKDKVEENYMEEVNNKILRYKEDQKVDGLDEGADLAANDKQLNQSRKAYIKDLKSVVDQSDVILEVLDARDPMGCRNLEMEHHILGQNKKLVLIMNKIDLVPAENARDWLKVLRDEYPTVLFKSTTQSQRHNLSSKINLHKSSLTERPEMVEAMLSGGKAVGTDNLVQLLKNYCRNETSTRKDKHSIIVGVIGFPNVGKSSLINSIKRSRVASTGNLPGVTKGIQEIYIDKDISILDSPGVILSKDNADSLILRNVIKVDDLDDPVTPCEALVMRVNRKELLREYKIPNFNTINEFLASVARKTGKLSKGAIPDINASAKIVLRDWNNGKIAYHTPVSTKRLGEIKDEDEDQMEQD
jgi:nuclear GTP-binding protein